MHHRRIGDWIKYQPINSVRVPRHGEEGPAIQDLGASLLGSFAESIFKLRLAEGQRHYTLNFADSVSGKGSKSMEKSHRETYTDKWKTLAVP